MRHKETIYQPPHSGIPGHWVVQYYDATSPFPHARYFSTREKAEAFEQEICDDANQLHTPIGINP